MSNFKRGYVLWVRLPRNERANNAEARSYIMEGEHFAIMLHDDDHPDIDSRTALVMPITSALAEVKKAAKQRRDILASYVEIERSKHPFLDHDSYVSTGQVAPINRNWIIEYRGQVDPDTMDDIDLQVINNLGLMDMAVQIGEKIYKDKLNEQEHIIQSKLISPES